MHPLSIPRLRLSMAIVATLLICACRLSAEAGEAEKASPRFLLEWGEQGKGPGELDFPIGVAVEPDRNVVVSDFYNARVQRFSPEGRPLAAFAVLPNPGGIAVDRQGNVYLTHFSAMKQNEEKKPDRVSMYTPKGEFLRQWGKSGKGDGEFDYPGGLAVSPDGRIYVADQTNHRVQVFDAKGKLLFKWGEFGIKEGQFGGNITIKSRVGGPNFIALDAEGNVYTTEGSMCRVQKFTADGKFVLSWGTHDNKPGGFGGTHLNAKGSLHGPLGICVDPASLLWIGSVGGRMQQFTKEGKYLRGIGDEQGSEPGQFNVPHGVAQDGLGNLYVVDSYNHRIQKFAIGN